MEDAKVQVISLALLCARTQVLLDAHVGSFKDATVAISNEATQEAALEELLAKVRGFVMGWMALGNQILQQTDGKAWQNCVASMWGSGNPP